MHYFEYKNGELYCEDVPIADIVKAVKTPCYVYSYKTLERHFLVFDNAFKGIGHIVCYSCKANSNVAVLAIMGRLGAGADIVSQGELFRALSAGIPAEKIVFSGAGKTADELRAAIKAKILMINVESEDELRLLSQVAAKAKRRVPVSIRVNPEIDAKTHPYITTGLKKNKFGIIWEDALRLYGEVKNDPYLDPVGISSHIGSQILQVSPFLEAVRSLKSMATELKNKGIAVRYLDIGGGLGITYKNELPPHPDDYASVIAKELEGTGITLILEPGRVIVGNSGIFVTKLLYVKRATGKTFYIVDGAMNDLVRPALYDAYHEIISLKEGNGRAEADKQEEREKNIVDVVGPICESGDFFAKDRAMPHLQPGAMLAVMGAGAYGFSMSSNYNSRRRAAEVLVKGGQFFVIRKRETFRDLIKGESIPLFVEVA